MKERPILFSGAMVRAILSGQKTQTRRVVNPYPPAERSIIPYLPSAIVPQQDGTFAAYTDGRKAKEFRCPYGQPGDRLWVRECFAVEHQVEPDQPPPFNDGRPILRDPDSGWRLSHYRATDPAPELSYEDGCSARCPEDGHVHWKPSIHMPRWACRLVLEIVSVRVERLQDISRGDAMEEGCPFPNMIYETDPVAWFADLWCTINGPESWIANPWAWVVEFKRVTP